jgi:hypothetical protein
MAAGLGFKDFVTGEVLTAADVDGYLMQGVWVFASAAARDAAVTSPQEGNFAYLKDTNVTTYYTGSAWANLDTTGMTNPMTTTGDTIYSSSGSTPARLGIGTAGQVLQVNSGATAPEWATPASGTPSFVGAKATANASTSLPNSTWTAIAFQTEDFDTDSFHSTVTNNTRITIPSGKAGKYLFIGTGGLNSTTGGATGRRFLSLYKNGSQIVSTQVEFTATAAAVMQLQTTAILDLIATDYIEVFIFQSSGGTRDTDYDLTRLTCEFLGA